jgi:AcrR family transcriptional regulator
MQSGLLGSRLEHTQEDQYKVTLMAQRLKKQQGEATRKRILEVTARRFAELGFEGISLESIAKDVGVAKSSVLWHFGSKEALLYEVVNAAMNEWKQGQAEDPLTLTDARERISRIVDVHKAFMTGRPDTLLLLLTVMFEGIDANPELAKRFREMYEERRMSVRVSIDRGIQDGAFRQDVSSEQLAAFLIAGFDGMFVQWYLDRTHFDLNAAAEQLKKVVFRFIDAPVSPPQDVQVSQPGVHS